MKAVTLSGHFDGQSIQLDEPYAIPSEARLLITVLPESSDSERADWYARSKSGLAGAYSDDEPGYGIAPEKVASANAAEKIPAWKRPGPRLVIPGLRLSDAILEERQSGP